MSPDHPSARWLRRVERDGSPIYLGLVRALRAAIREGELQAGDRLPPQRTVAELLGVDFTTVTRAYGAARDAGLVEGAVGRGTFVRRPALDEEAGRVDLSMNLPPPPDGVSLAALLSETLAAILRDADAATLMAYHPGAGSLGQRTAGAAWLRPVLGEVDPARVLVCPGAQAGITALLSVLARPGDTLVVEPLTYPGVLAAARQAGLRLLPCPVDSEGFEPEALDRLCAEQTVAGLYLTPTTQNPTAATMGLDRRREIVRIARARDLWLLEDDPYARLLDAPEPAIAALAPERTCHLATLSKCLSPGLRTAFLAAPEVMVERVTEALRATALMGAPLMTAAAARWIREGQAETLLAGVRREARARRAIAAQVLPAARGAAEGLHVWLDLPAHWAPGRLHELAEARGLSLMGADAFATGPHPNGVRISLGGPARRTVLEVALRSVAEMVG